MIRIFYKKATGVEFIIKSQENIIIANRDFPKVVFKRKTVILISYIKQDISAG